MNDNTCEGLPREEVLKAVELAQVEKDKSIGFINYDAYRRKAGNKTYDGQPMLQWQELGKHICEQWVAGAAAVLAVREDNNLGQVNYDAYSHKAGNTTRDGRPMLNWESLGDKIREQWQAGASAVLSYQKTREDFADAFPADEIDPNFSQPNLRNPKGLNAGKRGDKDARITSSLKP